MGYVIAKVCLAAVVACVGCVAVGDPRLIARLGPKKTWQLHSAEEMKAGISKSLPVGSSRATAERFLRGELFRCRFVTNGEFCSGDWGETPIEHHNIDFVEAERLDYPLPGVDVRWTIGVVIENDRVKDVLVFRSMAAL